ncbi:RepA leader peptide Tap [Pantoea sp. Mhis]|nr:RepA leader peptide Tap [Pantoea sp. Mhis]
MLRKVQYFLYTLLLLCNKSAGKRD